MKLSELKTGESGVIAKVSGRGAFRKRITEMGFVKGKRVDVIKSAPLLDPVEYSIMGYKVSLRRNEAAHIDVITVEEAKNTIPENYNGIITEEILQDSAKKIGRTINVALVGNPNAGKTSIFNVASGSHEHVGNYSGVTVDYKEACFKYKDYTFNITDLPGTYSLSAYTPEEVYVRKYIAENHPDVIINVIDSSNLERNLYLTTQLIDMDVKVVVCLNMFDELERHGDRFDYKAMGRMIGCPMVPTVGSKGKGLSQLFDTVINVYTDNDTSYRHIHINYGHDVERSIGILQKMLRIPENAELLDHYSSRYLSIKLLEKDPEVRRLISGSDGRHHHYHSFRARRRLVAARQRRHRGFRQRFDDVRNYIASQGDDVEYSSLRMGGMSDFNKPLVNGAEIIDVADREIHWLEKHLNDDSETIITDAKYGFVAGALKETFKEGSPNKRKNTETIDVFMTHRFFGFPIFLFFIWLTFFATFTLGEYPKSFLEEGVGWIMNWLNETMAEGPFKDLLVNGIINGVGNVIVFLPNILILFFFISLLEDTGYMARAAFIMDKLMHKIGLHGKSFIPLIMGFGCNVPAIMATRTIESRSSRLLTMLIAPLMSCSARLPIYLLILGAFFPEHAATLLFVIYLTGILLAILMALLFKHTLFRHQDVPFVMELPPYRIPTMKATMRHMWFKGSQYLRKMGGIILVAVIFVWVLSYFPREVNFSRNFELEKQTIEKQYDQKINGFNNSQPMVAKLTASKDSLLRHIDLEMQSERQQSSYLGRIGMFIEPVMRPLGFDWKMSVALLSALPAKEIVVSTMGVIYQVEGDAEEDATSLIKKLRDDRYTTGPHKGQKVYTQATALSFLMFVLVYFPCVAVVAALRKESGSWRWALFSIFYTTTLAWIVSFVVYNVARLFI